MKTPIWQLKNLNGKTDHQFTPPWSSACTTGRLLQVGDSAQTLLGGDRIIPESCFADTKTDVKADTAADVAAKAKDAVNVEAKSTPA